MNNPVIGIVLDREKEGEYSTYPYYVLREDYFTAIINAGGIPIGLDLNARNIDSYVQLCDGLLLPGGDYDIPPEMYGGQNVHESVVTKTERLQYDIEITEKFLESDKPILGICAGQQLLTVLFGGTLIQDIPTEVPGSLNHYEGLRTEAVHDVFIKNKTLLHNIINKDSIMVNSHHHQAAKTVGSDMIVSAVSSDGIIEAVESIKHSFCIGLEWHPEFAVDESEQNIFKHFVAACK